MRYQLPSRGPISDARAPRQTRARSRLVFPADLRAGAVDRRESHRPRAWSASAARSVAVPRLFREFAERVPIFLRGFGCDAERAFDVRVVGGQQNAAVGL